MSGDISVDGDLVIQGEIRGNVVGADTVFITRSARLHGQVTATRIQFECGADLDGVILVGRIAQTD